MLNGMSFPESKISGFGGIESWRRLPTEAKLEPAPDIHVSCCTKPASGTPKITADDLILSRNELADKMKKYEKEHQTEYMESLKSRYITKAQALGLCRRMMVGDYRYNRWYGDVVAIPADELLRLPDADVVPAKRAHWIPKAECGYPNRIAECSRCGYRMPYPGETYCPHCGAEMEDEDDGRS
mgnify:FL=1